MQKKEVKIPNVTLYSEYFKCPRCGWTTDGPRLVRGDIAQCPCEKCGHSYLVRVKQEKCQWKQELIMIVSII